MTLQGIRSFWSSGKSCSYLLSRGSSLGEGRRGPKCLAGDGGLGPLCWEEKNEQKKVITDRVLVVWVRRMLRGYCMKHHRDLCSTELHSYPHNGLPASVASNHSWGKPRIPPFSTFQFPIMHSVCPQKFCINYCCGMPLRICRPPKSSTTIAYAKFGGQTERIMDNWKIVNREVFKWLPKNQNQSNYSDQSQQEQTARWTNHNS